MEIKRLAAYPHHTSCNAIMKLFHFPPLCSFSHIFFPLLHTTVATMMRFDFLAMPLRSGMLVDCRTVYVAAAAVFFLI
jgi:hypothetical protein